MLLCYCTILHSRCHTGLTIEGELDQSCVKAQIKNVYISKVCRIAGERGLSHQLQETANVTALCVVQSSSYEQGSGSRTSVSRKYSSRLLPCRLVHLQRLRLTVSYHFRLRVRYLEPIARMLNVSSKLTARRRAYRLLLILKE